MSFLAPITAEIADAVSAATPHVGPSGMQTGSQAGLQTAPAAGARLALARSEGLTQTVALPAPSQFAGVVELIKSVFQVPAVAIALHGAPTSTVTGPEAGAWGAFLEIPLERGGKAIGSLRLLDAASREFTERDCALLDGFAKLVVEQVDLWAAASRDVLTGAMTRRAFDATLERGIAAQGRHRGEMALLLFDLDHFKRINDTLGHAAGDAVLRAVSRKVLGELRLEDAFGRVGGEEFAVLLTGADAARAMEVAGRLRSAIAAMDTPGYPDLRVTASFGVATWGAATAGRSSEALMALADEALYSAKENGRNRAVLAQPRSALAC